MCLLVISVSSLDKCLFKSFGHFFLLLSCRILLHILDILYQKYYLQISFPILWVAFTSLDSSFGAQNFLILM